jgi:hypothetical protein
MRLLITVLSPLVIAMMAVSKWLAGIVGISAFALYFLGGYVAGLSGAEWVVVFILGLALGVGYAQIEKKTETLSDADFIAVVQREVKKRRDSIEQFEKGGRPELAEIEKKEIVVLETFLPKALSPEELEQMVKVTIQEIGATSKKEMGPVIKAVQTKAAGRADGKTISGLVGRLLP